MTVGDSDSMRAQAHTTGDRDGDDRRLPISSATSARPWTTPAMAPPMKVTRLLDTWPPAIRRPSIENLPLASDILGEVESDEHRMGEWPIGDTGERTNSPLHDRRNWSDTHRCMGSGGGVGAAQQGRRSPDDRLVGHKEVEQVS